MANKDEIRNIIELFIAWNGETEPIDVANIDSAVEFIGSSLQAKPKFKTGDRIKPVDSCLGSSRTIVDVCDSWYVTNQGTLDFEFEDNWELAEEPVSEDLGQAAITAADEDMRYKENLDVKRTDLQKKLYDIKRACGIFKENDIGEISGDCLNWIAKHFFELGLKVQKDNIQHSMDETPNYPCDILFVTDVNTVFLYRYMENGRPVDRETPYFHNIQNGKCWYYCNDIINLH